MSAQQATTQSFIDRAFQDAKTAVTNPCTAQNLFIWGGQFHNEPPARLEQFLQAWQADGSLVFRWMMVEEVDEFYVKPASLPNLIAQHTLLERARLFGEAGDLDIRRDADTIHWRFISEAHAAPPALPAWVNAVPFPWDERENQSFARHEQCYYQWRQDNQEQRVKRNWLEDSSLAETGLMLRQVQYLENGRIAFVRYVNIEEVSA